MCVCLRVRSFGYVVSMASLSEMIVALEPSGSEGLFNGALTTIRLLRLLKLARYWKGLKMVLRILGIAIRSGVYLLMLVLLFMFVMGLLGLQVRRVPADAGDMLFVFVMGLLGLQVRRLMGAVLVFGETDLGLKMR